jgi:ABC-type transport system involved in multi-copper enzyme maturation permease subunit
MLTLLAALLGPIFAKEMVEMSRRARYYFNRVFYGSSLLVAASVVWDESYASLHRGTHPIQAMANMANQFFIVVSCLQCAAVFLFVPIFLCGVIASEREDRTLDLLFTTTLADREIVVGKLMSRLAVAALIILSALPVMSLFMLFGGIDPAALWRVELATLVAMIYAGAQAIFFSATSRTPLGALLRTYWWLILWLVALPGFIVAILANTTSSPFVPVSQFFLSILACVNPLGPFFIAVEPRVAGVLTSGLGAWSFFLTSAVPVGWSLFLINRAIRHVRMIPQRHAKWLDRVPGVRAIRWIRGVWEPVLARVDRVLVHWHRSGEVANPLWQRARVVPVYDRDGYLRRIQSLSWVVAFAFFWLFFIFERRDLFDEGVAMAFMGFVWGGITLLTIVVSATGLVGDRRRGLLELILTTPINQAEFVDGSIRAVAEHLRRVFWLPLVLTTIFCVFGDPPLVGGICSVMTATLFLLVIVEMGTLCSITARNVGAALLLTIMLPVVMLGGTLLFTAFAEEAGGPMIWVLSGLSLIGTRFWTRRSVSTPAVACHFIAMHLAITSVATFWTYDGHREQFPVGAMHPGFLTLVTLDDKIEREFSGHAPWFLVVPCYWTALVVNIVWARRWMVRHFDRLVERVPQSQWPTSLLDRDCDRIWASLRTRLFRPRPLWVADEGDVGETTTMGICNVRTRHQPEASARAGQ